MWRGICLLVYGKIRVPVRDIELCWQRSFHCNCRSLDSNLRILSQKKLMGQSKEINQNWMGPRNFDICFCVNFSCYNQSLIPGKEAGHLAMS